MVLAIFAVVVNHVLETHTLPNLFIAYIATTILALLILYFSLMQNTGTKILNMLNCIETTLRDNR